MSNIRSLIVFASIMMSGGCGDQALPTDAERNEAKAALLQIATLQERFYLENQTYTNDMTQLRFATDPYVTESGSYTVDINPRADSNNFSAVAIYKEGEFGQDGCLVFTIDGLGNNTSRSSTDCWRP